MPTIAVVGAGLGLGLSVAGTFGTQGFGVALVARDPAKLRAMNDQLSAAGVDVAAFEADIGDHAALAGALAGAAQRFGPIDVLEFSPYAGLDVVNPVDATVDGFRQHIEVQLYGAATAVRAVLPSMLERRSGTLLFTMGPGAVEPVPILATLNAAQAALRNWAKNLHNSLRDQGVHVATVIVAGGISAEPVDYPHLHPDAIAQQYWDLYSRRDVAERTIAP